MKRATIFLLALVFALTGCAASKNWSDTLTKMSETVAVDNSSPSGAPAQGQQPDQKSALSETRVADGLRAALADGAARAVSQLGQKGGFWAHPARRIALPGWVDKASPILRGAGLSDEIKQLHLTMNRAAEQAVGEVGAIVRQAIMNMSVADAYKVLNGGAHAATQYLRRHAGDDLANRIRPVVANALSQSTAARRYQGLVSKAKPLLTLASVDINPNLNTYVTQNAMDGLFHLIARQEAKIRANPVARGTQLLRAVFGGK